MSKPYTANLSGPAAQRATFSDGQARDTVSGRACYDRQMLRHDTLRTAEDEFGLLRGTERRTQPSADEWSVPI